MVEYINLEDFYKEIYKIIDESKNKKIILVELGAYRKINDPKVSSIVYNRVKGIEKILKENEIDFIHYYVEDEELSKCLGKWKYIEYILLIICGIFAVLLIPVDIILRFVFKKSDWADRLSSIIFKPLEKIIQKKALSKLDKLKELVKNTEGNGNQVIIVNY
ncbi:hypothetical protein [Methanocaldococcus sp.]